MKFFKTDRKGSITVFTALTLSGIILFQCVLLQGAYVYTAQANVRYKLALAGQSLLAGFDRILYEDYGLLACQEQADGGAKAEYYFNSSVSGLQNLKEQAEKHLGSSETGLLRLMPMKGESFGFTASYTGSLADINVFQQEITELMKYRTPANLLEYLLECVDLLDSAEKSSEGERLYQEAGRLLDRLSELADKLYRAVEGWSVNDMACVNGFDNFTNRPLVISQIKTASLFLHGMSFTELTKGEAFEKLTELKNHCTSMKADYETYAELNRKALTYIAEVETLQSQITPEIEKIEAWLSSYRPEDSAGGDYKTRLEERVEELRSILRKTSYSAVKSKLQKNLEAFENALEKLDDMAAYLQEFDQTVFDGSYVIDCIEKAESAEIDTQIKVYTGKGSANAELMEADPREKGSRAEAEILKNLVNLPEIADSLYSTLPSITTPVSQVTLEEENLLAGVLIDDYILTYFSNSSGSSQIERSYFLEGETEYIINGNSSEQKNREDTLLKIFGIRTTLNLVHVVCSSDKMNTARSIGNAIAGALTCGIGGPLFTALVTAAWAMSEAALDIEDLKAGREVPLVKNKENWKLSIPGIAGALTAESNSDRENKASEKSAFTMDYKGYLRLLLFLTPQKIKLLRIQDVIEINLTSLTGQRWYLGNYYTGIHLGCSFMAAMLGPVYTMFQEDKSVKGYFIRRDVHVSY